MSRENRPDLIEFSPWELPPDGQVLWDLASSTFIPGTTWMWGSSSRVWMGVVLGLTTYTWQGEPRFGVELRYGVTGVRLPLWPLDIPNNLLQPSRSVVWEAPAVSKYPVSQFTRVRPNNVSKDLKKQFERAQATFERHSAWIWGEGASGRGQVAEVLLFKHHHSTAGAQVGVRMIQDFVVPVWPAAPKNLQLDPEDTFVEGYDWVAAALARAKPNRGSQHARRRAPMTRRAALPWLPLSSILPWVPAMRARGVSEVARSPRGFLTAYREARGDPTKLSAAWRQRRDNFVKRHMAQVEQRGESLMKNGKPTRRHLALIAWAYSPIRVS